MPQNQARVEYAFCLELKALGEGLGSKALRDWSSGCRVVQKAQAPRTLNLNSMLSIFSFNNEGPFIHTSTSMCVYIYIDGQASGVSSPPPQWYGLVRGGVVLFRKRSNRRFWVKHGKHRISLGPPPQHPTSLPLRCCRLIFVFLLFFFPSYCWNVHFLRVAWEQHLKIRRLKAERKLEQRQKKADLVVDRKLKTSYTKAGKKLRPRTQFRTSKP